MPINSNYSIPSANDVSTLKSNATANEQRARDNAAQNNGLLATPPEPVVRASPEALKQLETNPTQQSNNPASAYQSTETTQKKQQLAQQVKVDISV